MKKTITVFMLTVFSIFFFGAPSPICANNPPGETITEAVTDLDAVPSPEHKDVDGEVLLDNVPLDQFSEAADSLQRLLDQINELKDLPGRASEIIAFYPVVKDGLVTFVKQVRKPDSAEDVSFMIQLIADYAEVLAPLLLFMITFGFRMLKKNPVALLNAFGKAISFIRTRYFIIALGLGLSIAWAVFFRDESFTVISFVWFLFGTIFKGVGLNEMLKWIEGLFKKNDAVPAKA